MSRGGKAVAAEAAARCGLAAVGDGLGGGDPGKEAGTSRAAAASPRAFSPARCGLGVLFSAFIVFFLGESGTSFIDDSIPRYLKFLQCCFK